MSRIIKKVFFLICSCNGNKKRNPGFNSFLFLSIKLQIVKIVLYAIPIFISISIQSCNNDDLDSCNCTNSEKCDSIIGEWKYLGLNNERIVSIITHPCYDNIIYATSIFDFSQGKKGKIFKSIDCGNSWDTIFVGGGNGHPGIYSNIVFDKSNTDIIYAISGRILKTNNSGKIWYISDNGINIDWETNVVSFIQHPRNLNRFYSGTNGFYGGKLYQSNNNCSNWFEIKSINELLKGGITCIRIDPNNNHVYVGTTEGDLIKSTNNGKDWFYTGLSEKGIIFDLLIHPDSNNTIYSCLSQNGIMKSIDGGRTWKDFNYGLQNKMNARKIIYNPYNKDILITVSLFDSNGIYDLGGIYKLDMGNNSWMKVGLFNFSSSYYYSSLSITHCFNSLLFSGNGIYRINY